MEGKVLIIAGSDSGGGAGIQGDIKTITSLNSYAATAITALTAQNTEGVSGIHAVPKEFVKQQIESVLLDIGADVIKTGMLLNKDIIEAVAETISSYKIPIILDPVMIAKGGKALLEDDAIDALKEKLIPLSLLVTPNIPEAEKLSGKAISSKEDMIEAGKFIKESLNANAVLIKGGHLKGDDIYDILITDDIEVLESKRIDSKNTHGTGCTLASSIAAFVSKGENISDAVKNAREYVKKAIETAPDIGKGHGPLNHMHNL